MGNKWGEEVTSDSSFFTSHLCMLPFRLTYLIPFFIMINAHPEPAHPPLSSRSGKAQASKFFKVGSRSTGAMFASSFSAQDLRCLEVKNEIHDPSSPIGVIDDSITCFESSEIDSSETNSTESGPDFSDSKSVSRWHGFVNLWKGRSIRRLSTFPPFLSKKKSKNESESLPEDEVNNPDNVGHLQFNSSWKNFTLSDLVFATNNFSQENMIGKGGYAEVYKGCLLDGQLIAVKRLVHGTQEERTAVFLSELGIIAHLNHPNTAKLIGYGVEGGLHLVIQLSRRGNLDTMLHDSEETLDWHTRYKIALGTADGLKYLHENCQRRVIHRDIKAANILLTQDYLPQICDFGLAQWLPKQWTHRNVSKFEGTFGYFAPEYSMHGIVDEKIDVFAFGVLLLEIITGRRALDRQQQSIISWSKPLLVENKLRELADQSLGGDYNRDEFERVASTASMCIEHSPVLRPKMSQVAMLLRDGPSKCAKKRASLRRTYSEDLLDGEEYNSTRYLSDLIMHKHIAFGT